MNSDSFSQKEILLQLMGKVDSVTTALNKQELLLSSIHEASANRDEKIKDLKGEVQTLQAEVADLTIKVQSLKSFNKLIVAGWSFFILVISIFGKDILNKIF